MANQDYARSRLSQMMAWVRSPQGALVLIAAILGTIALVTSGWFSRMTAGIAAASFVAAVALLGSRQASEHRIVRELRRELQAEVRRAVDRAPRLDDQFDPEVAASRSTAELAAQLEAGRMLTDALKGLRSTRRARPSTANATWRSPDDAEGPLVTVVVPCFNEERFLSDCVESLFAQTFGGWQCVIVDDASTDGSLRLAYSYEQKDPRVRVVRHLRNSGLAASRNTGLHLTTTPYVTFLDADDFLLADSLRDRLTVAFGRLHEEALAGVFCGVEQAPETASPKDYLPRLPWPHRLGFRDFITSRGECPFNAHAPLLRTDVVRHFGGFDETFKKGAEDWELWLRIMRHGYYFEPSEHKTAIYRQKRRSMVRSAPTQHLEVARTLMSSAAEELPEDQILHGTPFVFEGPLSHYEASLRVSRRAISFAGLAAFSGQQDLDNALEALEPGSWELLRRHLDIEQVITDGIERALSVREQDLLHLSDRIDELRDALLDHIYERTQSVATEEMPTFEHESDLVDVLFVPQTNHQAEVLIDLADRLDPDLSTAFVITDRITGDQGAEDALSRAGLRAHSLTEWTLKGRGHQVVVTAYPFTSPVSEIVEATAALGGKSIEILSEDGVSRLEEAHVPSCDESAYIDDAVTIIEKAVKEQPGAVPARDLLQVSDESIPQYRLHIIEEYPHTRFDGESLSKFKDIHHGERVVIIGNGPSLNDLDLTKLRDECTIGVNAIFLARDRMDFDLSYYVVEDTSVMRENLDRIKTYRAGHKFFPSIYRDLVGESSDVTFFMMNRGFYEKTSPHYCVPRFSTNPSVNVFAGQSVTIMNLQLAYYMGFRQVVLIGMDFSYTIPDSAEREGDIITSTEADPNHFHPDYFGKGKTWKDPKLDRVLANYQLAKQVYEADDREILNATPGGNLEVFPRIRYDSLF